MRTPVVTLVVMIVGLGVMGGCRTPARSSLFIGSPTMESARAKGEVWSTGAGLPAGSTPTRQPGFQGCEHGIEIEATPRAGILSRQVQNAGGGPPVSEIDVTIRMTIDFECDAVDGSPNCIGTFQSITPVRQPEIGRPGAGAASLVGPVMHRVWWTMARGSCDGREYTGELVVNYLARYPELGLPAGGSDEGETLVLDLTSPTDADGQKKGKDYRLTLGIWRPDMASLARVRVKSLEERG